MPLIRSSFFDNIPYQTANRAESLILLSTQAADHAALERTQLIVTKTKKQQVALKAVKQSRVGKTDVFFFEQRNRPPRHSPIPAVTLSARAQARFIQEPTRMESKGK
jgi:hypothetical protein